jgi:hypothetical protein
VRFPQEWATPQALDDLALWFRNDDIPWTPAAATWPVPGGLGLSPAAQVLAAQQPAVLADPFGTDYRGLEFAAAESLALTTPLEVDDAFTYLCAFRTPAALLETTLLRGTTARLRISAAGAVVAVNDAGGSFGLAGAASIAPSTSYVLAIARAGGFGTCRLNGAVLASGVSLTGVFTLNTVGDGGGAGMTLVHAEHSLHEADHSVDSRLPYLERTLARYVGVEL